MVTHAKFQTRQDKGYVEIRFGCLINKFHRQLPLHHHALQKICSHKSNYKFVHALYLFNVEIFRDNLLVKEPW
jgi:hypothetical protein